METGTHGPLHPTLDKRKEDPGRFINLEEAIRRLRAQFGTMTREEGRAVFRRLVSNGEVVAFREDDDDMKIRESDFKGIDPHDVQRHFDALRLASEVKDEVTERSSIIPIALIVFSLAVVLAFVVKMLTSSSTLPWW